MLVAVVWAGACTSSNTATNINSNSGYDSQYREPTRSQSNYQQSQAPGTVQGDPPITLMMTGLETGDVYPGEDYYIYAVVDNPDNREIQFEWSVANGNLQDVPEAERGRLISLVETEKQAALNAGTAVPATGAGAPGETIPPEEPAVAPPATGAQNTPPAAPGISSSPAGAGTPAGSTRPAGTTSPGVPDAAPPGALAPVAGVSTSPPAGTPSTNTNANANQDAVPEEKIIPDRSVKPIDEGSKEGLKPGADLSLQKESLSIPDEAGDVLSPRELERYLHLLEQSDYGTLTPDESAELSKLEGKLSAGKTAFASPHRSPAVIERRIVSGPSSDPSAIDETLDVESTTEETDSEPMTNPEPSEVAATGTSKEGEGLSSSALSAVQAARAALAELGEEATSEPGNVADQSSPRFEEGETVASSPSRVGDYGDPAGLREEYRTWQDYSGTSRRRPLGSAIPESADGPVTADDSFAEYSFTTDEPFVLWTPQTQGDVTIYVRANYKDEAVTDVVELPVSIVLREPELSMSDEFPDIIHEDDNVIIRILGENIPEFYKGLITLTFDINTLSFRDAELGDFFDDAPAAKLFDAQPDKTVGKVLFAIDANTEITELSGSDPLLYLRFKAKQDITGQEQTSLAIVNDTSASYILDYNGDNILPVPVDHPVYKSAITQPPALENYPREPEQGLGTARQPVTTTGTGTQGLAGRSSQPITTGAGRQTTPVTELGDTGEPTEVLYDAERIAGTSGASGEVEPEPKPEGEDPEAGAEAIGADDGVEGDEENPASEEGEDEPGTKPDPQIGPQPPK